MVRWPSREFPAPAGRRGITSCAGRNKTLAQRLSSSRKREIASRRIEVRATESGWTALRRIETTHVAALRIDLLLPATPGKKLVARLE